MLRWRLLAAASILTPLALLLYADVHWNGGVPGIWVIPLGWLLTMAATAELLDLLTALDGRPSGWAVYLGSSVLFLAGCLPVAQGLFGVAVPLSRRSNCSDAQPWRWLVLPRCCSASRCAVIAIGAFCRPIGTGHVCRCLPGLIHVPLGSAPLRPQQRLGNGGIDLAGLGGQILRYVCLRSRAHVWAAQDVAAFKPRQDN